MLAFLATTTVYTTNSTNNFVYLTQPTTAAAAAGYILMSIINIIWMFYFGTTDETKFHTVLDSFSGHTGTRTTSYAAPDQQLDLMSNRSNPFNRDSALPTANMRQRGSTLPNGMSDNFASGPTDSGLYPQAFMAAPLGGFENSSDINPKDASYRQSHGSAMTNEAPPTPSVYPYRARAVYNCMYFLPFSFILTRS